MADAQQHGNGGRRGTALITGASSGIGEAFYPNGGLGARGPLAGRYR